MQGGDASRGQVPVQVTFAHARAIAREVEYQPIRLAYPPAVQPIAVLGGERDLSCPKGIRRPRQFRALDSGCREDQCGLKGGHQSHDHKIAQHATNEPALRGGRCGWRGGLGGHAAI